MPRNERKMKRFVRGANLPASSPGREDGALACWGDNDQGEATPSEGQFVAIAAGGDHGCALDVAGHARCFGVPLRIAAANIALHHRAGVRMTRNGHGESTRQIHR